MDMVIVGAGSGIRLPLTCTILPDLAVKDHILNAGVGDQAPAQDAAVASSVNVMCDIDCRDNPVCIGIMIGRSVSVGRISDGAIALLRAPGRHSVYLRA